MDEKKSLGCRLKLTEPAQQVLLVAMRGECVQLIDTSFDGNVIAMDSRAGGTIQQPSAASAGSLKSDEEHCVLLVRKSPLEMMQDAARRAHAAG